MARKIKAYHRPESVEEAASLLRRDKLSTRSTQIGPRPQAVFERGADEVVDPGRLELRYVRQEADGTVRLGAATPLQQLAEDKILVTLAGGLVAQAARHTAHYGLRNLVTVGGTLLSAGGAPDLLLALLALDAEVVVATDSQQPTPLDRFLESPPQGALPLEVRFPSPPAKGAGAVIEWVARSPMDEAIVAAAAYLAADSAQVATARLALAGAGPRPAVVPEAATVLTGEAWSEQQLALAVEAAVQAAAPESDFRASAEYRREMVAVLAKRALLRAWEQAERA